MNTLIANRQEPERVELSGWEYAKSGLDECSTPASIHDLDWQPATVPGTVAGELLHGQSINYDSVLPLDDDDFWYRSKFILQSDDQESVQLHLEGLATFAEVWLDDELVLSTDNMFCAHVLDVSKYLKKAGVEHCLSIRFCGLTPFLEKKHPRAKWRTPFVQHRNLRFVRTSLVGRTPGIFPQTPVVGPWRPVYFELRQAPSLSVTRLDATLVENKGVIDAELDLRGFSAREEGDRLSLNCGGCSTELNIESNLDGLLIARGQLEIEKPELWWPRTHGTPHTYDISIVGTLGEREVSYEHKSVGFRSIELQEPFAICVNGVKIFCKGACWRPLDFLSMNPEPSAMRRDLELAVSAGMNMLRITGETAYESDAFYSLCDELGIMVWQDFMFARLDYPVADEKFLSSITTEATQLLQRLSTHPCLTMLCGNTEVAQTAAMLGLDQDKWSNKWFDQSLPSLCNELLPAVPYWRSSPDGGDMPFYTDVGVSHYFGVGAYRQELVDAVVNAPVFASECLAFGIPSMGSIGKPIDTEAEMSSPADANASWSFLDITEYYTSKLFDVDIDWLKSNYGQRYRLLCALAIGEVMYLVQTQLRRKGIGCSGSLIISLNDVANTNGWGVIDAEGFPKAPYYFLKRAWQPLSLGIVDEGINGLKVVVHNDQPSEFVGTVVLSFYRLDGLVIHSGTVDVALNSRTGIELSAEAVIGHFLDSGYVYQFGDPSCDFVLGELLDESDRLTTESIFLPPAAKILPENELDIDIDITEASSDNLIMKFLSSSFVQSFTFITEDLEMNDNCFHLLPKRSRTVLARRLNNSQEIKMQLYCLSFGKPVSAVYSTVTKKVQVYR